MEQGTIVRERTGQVEGGKRLRCDEGTGRSKEGKKVILGEKTGQLVRGTRNKGVGKDSPGRQGQGTEVMENRAQ